MYTVAFVSEMNEMRVVRVMGSRDSQRPYGQPPGHIVPANAPTFDNPAEGWDFISEYYPEYAP
jgi:hypothetical protein